MLDLPVVKLAELCQNRCGRLAFTSFQQPQVLPRDTDELSDILHAAVPARPFEPRSVYFQFSNRHSPQLYGK